MSQEGKVWKRVETHHLLEAHTVPSLLRYTFHDSELFHCLPLASGGTRLKKSSAEILVMLWIESKTEMAGAESPKAGGHGFLSIPLKSESWQLPSGDWQPVGVIPRAPKATKPEAGARLCWLSGH